MRAWLRRQRVRLGWWLVGRPPEAQVLVSWNPTQISVRPLACGIGSPELGMRWIEIPTNGEESGEFFAASSTPAA